LLTWLNSPRSMVVCDWNSTLLTYKRPMIWVLTCWIFIHAKHSYQSSIIRMVEILDLHYQDKLWLEARYGIFITKNEPGRLLFCLKILRGKTGLQTSAQMALRNSRGWKTISQC
jgi:hypothetical protein